jgi:hypothetical protein
MRLREIGTGLVLLVALLVVRAQAHHSTGPYDMTRSATISGVVTQFAWINPHAYIFMDAKEGSATQHWKIEIESPNALRRSGWAKDSLKVGDTVTCIGARAKDPASLLMKGWIVVMPDGRQLSAQGEPLGVR